MDTSAGRRILIVAHKTVATPSLVHEIQRRVEEGPCCLALLIPDATDPAVDAWTLRRARKMLSKEVGVPVEGIVSEGDDPYTGVLAALREQPYDEILISTLPDGGSSWQSEGLPDRVREVGVPVTVVTAAPLAT